MRARGAPTSTPDLGHLDIDQLDAATIDAWLASIPTPGAARKAWA